MRVYIVEREILYEGSWIEKVFLNGLDAVTYRDKLDAERRSNRPFARDIKFDVTIHEVIE